MKAEKRPFGQRPDGTPCWLVRLENSAGAYVELIEYGAILHCIAVPDRKGTLANVALHKDSLAAYLEHPIPNAAVYGRIANRVVGGRFTVGGKPYTMPLSERGNFTLHCGEAGYNKRFFQAGEPESDSGTASVSLYLRDEGEGGLEVPVDFWVTYSFDEDNRLGITYRAIPEGDTVISPTNHCFFHLSGGEGPVGGQLLTLEADRYTPPPHQDPDPAGTVIPVAGTPMDFRTAKPIGQSLSEEGPGGYDHNYVLRGQGMRRVAQLYDPASGRVMTTSTDLPGLQLFTGRFPPGFVCLETQYFPDAVNRSGFASPVVAGGSVWSSRTEYAFAVR